MSLERILAIGVSTVVVVAIAAGLFVLGSPSEERSRLLDARRVADLQQIVTAIEDYHAREQSLPAALDVVASGRDLPWLRDPSTGERYEYRVVDERRYELCAAFDRDAEPAPVPRRHGHPDFSGHAAGRQCFEVVVGRDQ